MCILQMVKVFLRFLSVVALPAYPVGSRSFGLG